MGLRCVMSQKFWLGRDVWQESRLDPFQSQSYINYLSSIPLFGGKCSQWNSYIQLAYSCNIYGWIGRVAYIACVLATCQICLPNHVAVHGTKENHFYTRYMYRSPLSSRRIHTIIQAGPQSSSICLYIGGPLRHQSCICWPGLGEAAAYTAMRIKTCQRQDFRQTKEKLHGQNTTRDWVPLGMILRPTKHGRRNMPSDDIRIKHLYTVEHPIESIYS